MTATRQTPRVGEVWSYNRRQKAEVLAVYEEGSSPVENMPLPAVHYKTKDGDAFSTLEMFQRMFPNPPESL